MNTKPNVTLEVARMALARLCDSAERWAEGDSCREARETVREDTIDVSKALDVLDALSRASASDCYGLTNGPITLYACGEISGGRMRECIGEWVRGKRSWAPSDFGMTDWPTDTDLEPQMIRKQRDEAIEARDRWAHQCSLASEAQARAVNEAALARTAFMEMQTTANNLARELMAVAHVLGVDARVGEFDRVLPAARALVDERDAMALAIDTKSRAMKAWEDIANEWKACAREHAGQLDAIRTLLSENGCDCECDHDSESHDDECARCLACRIAGVVQRGTR